MRLRPRHFYAARRGFTLIEMAIGALLFAVVMSLTVQVLAWSASERRVSERRQRALYEATNILERLASLPKDDLSSESVKGAKLSDETRKALPGGELKVNYTEAVDGLNRLTVEVHYLDRAGLPVAPVRLVAFLAPREKSQ